MNEKENIVEQFNAELDGLFAGGRAEAAVSDPGALALAEKYARTDFSAASNIRESLRARLMPAPAPAEERTAWAFRLSFKTLLPAALAAACALLVIVPVLHKSGTVHPAISATAPRIAAVSVPAAAPGSIAPRSAAYAPAAAAPAPAEEEGFFHSIPMAGLGAGQGQGFPIETKKGGFPIALYEGRENTVPGGAELVWETESSVFVIERRVTSQEELFQRRTL